MKNHYYPLIGVDACDFDWDYNTFPEKEPFFARLKARGFDASLWINPYLPEGQPIYEEALQKGYLAGSIHGGISRLEFNEPVGIIDLTNPDARAWWKEHLKDLLRWGGSVLKCDYGDRVPETALFANGKTGSEMHNLFLHLYNEVAFEAREEVYGKGQGVVWRRAGYIGSQRFSGTWAGDTQVTWRGMRGALRGGLSAGFNADAFWSHDIGGFVGDQPSPELYIRWAQFGLLSPFSRFHGTTPREPWHYGEIALRVVRRYAALRYSLIPYIQALGFEAQDTGTPLMRHLKLEFPEEPGVEWIDDQYSLGPDLLMAPVLEEGARSRQVYFSTGHWMALEDPSVTFEGPGYREVAAPLESMPVFVRAGAVLPRYIEVPQHLKGPAAQQMALEIYPGDSQRSLRFDEGGPVSIDYSFSNAEGMLKISSARPGFVIRLVGWQAQVFMNGQALTAEMGPRGDEFTLPIQANLSIQLERHV
jgi:alpha-D-xyloside xylohydrolase